MKVKLSIGEVELKDPKFVDMKRVGINVFDFIKKSATLDFTDEDIDKILSLYFDQETINTLTAGDILKVVNVFAEQIASIEDAVKK